MNSGQGISSARGTKNRGKNRATYEEVDDTKKNRRADFTAAELHGNESDETMNLGGSKSYEDENKIRLLIHKNRISFTSNHGSSSSSLHYFII
jgi:hypothetical protein